MQSGEGERGRRGRSQNANIKMQDPRPTAIPFVSPGAQPQRSKESRPSGKLGPACVGRQALSRRQTRFLVAPLLGMTDWRKRRSCTPVVQRVRTRNVFVCLAALAFLAVQYRIRGLLNSLTLLTRFLASQTWRQCVASRLAGIGWPTSTEHGLLLRSPRLAAGARPGSSRDWDYRQAFRGRLPSSAVHLPTTGNRG